MTTIVKNFMHKIYNTVSRLTEFEVFYAILFVGIAVLTGIAFVIITAPSLGAITALIWVMFIWYLALSMFGGYDEKQYHQL